MTKNEDLKVCPWCGKTDRAKAYLVYKVRWGVCCERCDIFMDANAKTPEAAVEYWNARPTVAHADSAMEDNTGRSGSNGMASVEGSTPSLPNPSTTAGDAERALEWFNFIMACFPEKIHECEQSKTIRTALQSTRKPPTVDWEIWENETTEAIAAAKKYVRWYKNDSPNPPYPPFMTQKNGVLQMQMIIEAAEKYLQTSKPPVDTISIKREVLQGVREALKSMKANQTITFEGGLYLTVAEEEVDEVITSLDAVLAGDVAW